MTRTVAFFSGVLFAVGLVVGGMTQPDKIIDFLDVTGQWDPSLAFVMGGALLVHRLAYRWTRTADEPVFDRQFHLPTADRIDWRLLTGSAIFGVGWGLGGYCPGPALTALVSEAGPALATVGGMAGGIALFRAFERLARPNADEETPEAGPE